MIVCSCHGITDRDLRAAYGPGGSGSSPAGSGCGGCRKLVLEILDQRARPERDVGDPRDGRAARDARR